MPAATLPSAPAPLLFDEHAIESIAPTLIKPRTALYKSTRHLTSEFEKRWKLEKNDAASQSAICAESHQTHSHTGIARVTLMRAGETGGSLPDPTQARAITAMLGTPSGRRGHGFRRVR
jgi:hypothetical protein